MSAWYNEIDPYAAQWLRNLIAAGMIAPGDVDEDQYERQNWTDTSNATSSPGSASGPRPAPRRMAGRQAADRPCPCQPFSQAAGEAASTTRGTSGPLVRPRRRAPPAVVLGEQVEAAIGRGWLDLVQTDLERGLRRRGGVCLLRASARHLRHWLFFVAERIGHVDDTGSQGRRQSLRRMADRPDQLAESDG